MKYEKYYWLNEESRKFLSRGYISNQSPEQRIKDIANTAERILGIKNFAAKFEDYMSRGYYSLSTPVWCNFGKEKSLPISCYGSNVDDTLDSILNAGREVGMMSKYGGGTSIYLGNIRERGKEISAGGYADGPPHYAVIYDTIIDKCKQGECYTDDTEILTDKGFKLFKNVKKEDLIAEVDKFGNINFTKNYNLIEKDYEGNIDIYQSIKKKNSFSLKVTPNHRMVINKRKQKNNKKYWSNSTEIIKSEELNLHRDNRIMLSGKTQINKDINFNFEDALNVAYQADGQKDFNRKKVRFHFSKKRKILRLKLILDNLNIKYDEKITKSKTTKISFYKDNLKFLTFHQKYNLKNISYNWCIDFLNEISLWDGSKKNQVINYSSIIKDNVDFIQEIASISNYKSIINKQIRNNKTDLYSITLSQKNYKSGDSLTKYQEYYKGKVYCATVNTGKLLVKHNNITSICGNSRRGACALWLPLEHGDIKEFLNIGTEGNDIQNLQYGVTVTDKWLQSMIDGDNNKRDIWAKVIQRRSEFGFPYIMFKDNTNNNTPYKELGLDITASNLCSEIQLPTDSFNSFVCCLGSINLLHWDEIVNTDAIETYTLFLNAVIEEFVSKSENLPGMKRAWRFAKDHRAIGLGVLGYNSYLQSKLIPVESLAAKSANYKIFSTIEARSQEASKWCHDYLGYTSLRKGYANTTVMAIAPTKSSSYILGQVSMGIEPIKSNYFIKDLAKVKSIYKNQFLKNELEKYNLDTPEVWQSILDNDGSCQHLDFPSKKVFKSFIEISPKELVLQAAQRQKFIDQSQSLNLMIHPDVSAKEINKLYLYAWKEGVKTLYYQFSQSAAQSFARDINECINCEA